MTLSWKAIRSGPIYCSPRCGGKCTWEQYQHAKRKAAALAKRCGVGWKPHVWENLGWHWSAVGSVGQVYDQSRGRYERGGSPRYWCSVNIAGVGHFGGEARTPKEAIRRARKAIERAAEQTRSVALALGGEP